MRPWGFRSGYVWKSLLALPVYAFGVWLMVMLVLTAVGAVNAGTAGEDAGYAFADWLIGHAWLLLVYAFALVASVAARDRLRY